LPVSITLGGVSLAALVLRAGHERRAVVAESDPIFKTVIKRSWGTDGELKKE
jgi:hypothetical protein